MRYVIFDLDGTLTDCEHRLHHIRSKPRRFDRFERDIPLDGVIEAVAGIYRRFVADPDVTVILLTGRNETSRGTTEQWLTDNDLTGYDALYMKEESFMQDVVQKEGVLDALIARYGGMPEMVFEDRARVVEMWKRRGVFVLNVDQTEIT